MKIYKKCALVLFISLLLSACGKNENIESDKLATKEPDKVVVEENVTEENYETTPTKEPEKPTEKKSIEGFYNCVEKENHFVRVDFEIKCKDDGYVALFYSQYTIVDTYDCTDIFYGKEIEDNKYEFICNEEKYIVTCNDKDELIIEGNEFGGIYVSGLKDGYGEGEYTINTSPAYETDKNVEQGIELDSTLAKAIRAELGYITEHILTHEDLERVTYLATWDYEIVSVKGISYLKNLEEIHFGTNYISDISEMTQLSNIRVIDLCNGYVSEFPDFSQCNTLTALYLNGNKIKDLTNISKIPNLEFLDVNNNFITSIEPLKEAKSLKTLCIYNNCILDYNTVEDCGFLRDAYNNSGQCTLDEALDLEKRAKEIVATFPKDLSEIQLEKTIYQYIIDNMYFSENACKTTVFGYYGLMSGSGVCGDYAEAFALLANHAGLEAYECDSDTHAWNIVKIGDKYYHCDALWDDGAEEWIHFNKSTGYIINISDHSHDLMRYPICEESMSRLEYFED